MLATSDDCSGPGLLTVGEALALALARVREVSDVEILPVRRCVGRVAVEDVAATMPLPPFDQSAVDGYGILSEDIPTIVAGSFRQSGRGFAGAERIARPDRREVARLLTGAALPPGVDAVVMEEKVRLEGDTISFSHTVSPGLNIRRQGKDVRAGSVILKAGTLLDARHVAILAATGVAKMRVRRRIKVAVLSTGSELVPAGRPLSTFKIHDSNGPMLQALLEAPAVQVTSLGRCRDDKAVLVRRMRQIARSYDLLVCSGGVSGSDADHVVASVIHAGGLCTTLSLALKPGKPLATGRLGELAVLALPGNPFASLVGALLFVRPMLKRIAGSSGGAALPLTARANGRFEHRPGRLEFMPVRVVGKDDLGNVMLEKLGRGGSARLLPLIAADGLASIPAESGDLKAGAPLDFYPFDSAFRL